MTKSYGIRVAVIWGMWLGTHMQSVGMVQHLMKQCVRLFYTHVLSSKTILAYSSFPSLHLAVKCHMFDVPFITFFQNIFSEYKYIF